jgi:predicted dienelactone hydrolase
MSLFAALLLPLLLGLRGPSLPKPTGPYRVATSVFHLADSSRPDLLSKTPGRPRELMLQVWYPTDAGAKAEVAPYIPDAALLQALKDTQHDFQDAAVFDAWKEVRTDAALDAPLPRRRAKFPLLFFSHGLGEPRTLYTAVSQDLASHGYVVVCIDHPYGGVTVLPGGRVVTADGDPDAGSPDAAPRQTEAWAKDASFVLDRMTSRGGANPLRRFVEYVDPARVGMLGHSLGGAAALEACRADSRFKACADLDGAPFGKVVEEGLKRPTLVMRSGPVYSDEDLAKRGRTREQWEEMGRKGREMWGSLFRKSKNVPVYSVKINGAGHMSYSDAPFVMPDTINRFGGRIIEARRGFRIMTDYVRDFFGKYLRGKRSELLDGARTRYAEVSAERFNL